jgi:Carboxypeptidase regulatory-like domain/TonB dependent receptor
MRVHASRQNPFVERTTSRWQGGRRTNVVISASFPTPLPIRLKKRGSYLPSPLTIERSPVVAATALGLPFTAQKESFSSRPPILSGSRWPDLRQPYIPEEMGMQGKSLKCLRLISALVLLSVMLFGIQARTQEVTAGITGTVTDHSGAVVVDALVTATDIQRGTSFSTRSNADGIYYLQRIPVGTYRLRAESEAFSTATLPSFTLVLNQNARLDFHMELGSIKEVVEVSAVAPLLQTQSSEVSTVIDAETNVALPLASRNYVQLALLAPGAVTPNRETIANANRIDMAGQPYINGNREQANNFLLDGMDNNQVSDNLVAYSPSPDAIQEFNLITQNASAEFGNFQGGIISVSVKSGTNQFHGDLWEFFRNDKLNANNFFNNFFQLPRPTLRWNMFGGTVGGPILKKKLFFFADYQGQRFDVYSDNAFSALTGLERAGDFGQLCTDSNFTGGTYSFNSSGICVDSSNSPGGTQILDPFTQTPIPNNNLAQYISTGTDPQLTAYYNSGAGKVFQNLVNTKYYPSVASLTSTSIINNYSFSTRIPLNVDQGDFKVDYNLSERDHFSGRYSREEQVNNPVNSFLLAPVNLGTAIMSNGVLDWTHSFNTRLVNDFRLGVNWVQLLSNSATPGVGNLGEAIGISDGNAGGEGLPAIFIGPSSSVGGDGTILDWSNTVIQVGDTLDITRGRHVFHVGFQFLRERLDDGFASVLGDYFMTGIFTGSGDSDFYLGMVNFEGQYFSNGGSSTSPEVWGQRSTVFGAFVQDNWRLTSNLTLSLGLRYQVHTPWTEVEGRQVNYGIYTGQPYYPAGSPLPGSITFPGLQPEPNSNKALYNGYHGIGDWQPRLGIAYTPGFLHGKTVVRAAFTASDYLEGTGNALRLPINIPFNVRLQFTNVIPPGVPGYNPAKFQIADGIPSPTTGDPFSGAVLNVWAPDVRPAMTQQWNLALQQQLSSDTTLQVAYVGQRGTHLMVPLNMLQGDLQSDGTVLPSPYLAGNPDLLAKGVSAAGTFSIGEMSYNALQVVLQKRMGHGLAGQVSYTYSHCLTNNIGYYGDGAQAAPQSPYWQNTFNPKAEWGSCYFDLTHNLTAFAIYELPVGRRRSFGRKLNPIVNAALGGWNVSTIYSLHGGFPLTIYGNDSTTTNSRGPRADCNGGPKYVKQFIPGVGLQWFSPAPYSNPADLTFGTCGVGTVRGPGLNRFDIGLQKEFPVHESMRFEFRAEFLNAFNHPTFEVPKTYCGGSAGAACAPGMGVIAFSEGERNIQFALKFYF